MYNFKLLHSVPHSHEEVVQNLKTSAIAVKAKFDKEMPLDMALEFNSHLDQKQIDTKDKNSKIMRYLEKQNQFNQNLEQRISDLEKDSNVVSICEKYSFDSKDEAILKMHHTIKLIEILWSEMIALEVLLDYKQSNSNKNLSKLNSVDHSDFDLGKSKFSQ